MYSFVFMITDETILNYYAMGYELSLDDRDFPFWFETVVEKHACLLGYTDADLNITREDEEILKEIKWKTK